MDFAWTLPEVEHAIKKGKKEFKPADIWLTHETSMQHSRTQPLQDLRQGRRWAKCTLTSRRATTTMLAIHRELARTAGSWATRSTEHTLAMQFTVATEIH